MSSTIEERLVQLGLELPEPAAAAGAYIPSLIHNGLLYISGQLPLDKGEIAFRGRLGAELDVAAGQEAARLAAKNALAHARKAAGSLDAIARCLKITGYIAATPTFTEQAKVVNGASNLVHDLFGERGQHVRVSIGVASLPLEAAVEVEMLFALA
jgi:enamine deaminase RidA (YjgF/YER057c/UK114 family)